MATIVLGGCNPSSTNPDDQPTPFEGGVYVLCEGSFSAGNASLWYYNHITKVVTPDVFGKVNNAKLGDGGQSLYLHNNTLFVVVNNSGVVYALEATTGEVLGLIDGLISPSVVAIDDSGTKGYISQMNTNKLITFDPRTLAKTGEVELEGVVSSEQMAFVGDKLFIASWSNDHKITVLDSTTNKQLATFTVGVQPYSLALDKQDTLWVVCDGGNAFSSLPEGVEVEDPSLWKINTENYVAEKVATLPNVGAFRLHLATNKSKDKLLLTSDALWEVDVESGKFSDKPIVSVEGFGYLYGLGVHPTTGDIYIADAKDFASNGTVSRYNSAGELLDVVEVGISPKRFVFLPQ